MKQVKDAEEHLVTVGEFARIVGVSERSLRYIIVNKGLPVVQADTSRKSQKINAPAGIAWWVNNEIAERGLLPEKQKDKGGNIVGFDINSERLRKVRAEREKIERENSVRAGELLEAAEVRVAMDQAVVLLKSNLEGLSGKLGAGNATRRKQFQETFRSLLIQYQNQLRACFTDPQFVEAPPTSTG